MVIPLAVRVALPGLANSLIEIPARPVVLSVVAVVEIFYSRTLYFYQFYSGRHRRASSSSSLFFVAIGVPAAALNGSSRRLRAARLAFPT